MNENKIIRSVTSVGIVGNIILVIFKLYAGIVGKSGAMVSDAVHSLSDVFATFVAFIGVRISRKAPDSLHPYGHDRFECLASMILGLILLGTGIGIGISGVNTIIAGNYGSLEMPCDKGVIGPERVRSGKINADAVAGNCRIDQAYVFRCKH